MIIVKNEHNIDDILLNPDKYITSGVNQPLIEIHNSTSPIPILLEVGALPVDREYPIESPFYIVESKSQKRQNEQKRIKTQTPFYLISYMNWWKIAGKKAHPGVK